VRDAPEVETSGKVEGALHVPRGIAGVLRRSGVPLLRQGVRQKQAHHPILCFRRTLGALRKGAEGVRLREGLQSRSLHGLGGSAKPSTSRSRPACGREFVTSTSEVPSLPAGLHPSSKCNSRRPLQMRAGSFVPFFTRS
jgi:hypothetical protein